MFLSPASSFLIKVLLGIVLLPNSFAAVSCTHLLVITDEEIIVKVLESIDEYYNEGKTQGICVFPVKPKCPQTIPVNKTKVTPSDTPKILIFPSNTPTALSLIHI